MFKEEYAKEKQEFNALGLKSQRRNLRQLPQVNVKGLDKERDASRKALMPGKRISKNGNVYFETRSNRTDQKGSNL